ncbi:MAG: hypothetical protein CMC05_03110 [Flavobacteriaceae bacterium]|nr:hypothetical protein [Flavobacteriaceae bacterium]MBD09791.1 hypothetical protein [Flavobacteriaceae bacterium]
MQQQKAGYILEGIQKQLKKFDSNKVKGLLDYLSCFDIESNIPESIDESKYVAYFKVINNQIVRGLPTKPSIYIEETFSELYGQQQRDNSNLAKQLGFIAYNPVSGKNNDQVYSALHLIDPRLQYDETNYNTQLLGSNFEKQFLFNYLNSKKASYLNQVFQPQRAIDTIVPLERANEFNRQQVDFAIEIPYKSAFTYKKYGEEKIGYRKNIGAIIEIEGAKYHAAFTQKILDSHRDNSSKSNNWETLRVENLQEQTAIPWLQKQHKDIGEYLKIIEQNVNKSLNRDEWREILEQVLAPFAVARLQKTIVDRLISGVLSIDAKEWNIAVFERDIPCAVVAIKDLKTTITKLFQMSSDKAIRETDFPKINLTVISTKEFKNSKLHLNQKVVLEDDIQNTSNFDLFIDISMFRRSQLEANKVQSHSNWIKIRSVHYVDSKRTILTSNTIKYRKLTKKLDNDVYENYSEACEHLRYFVQNIFRKNDFRKGQLPILNRALQGKSVIGLLPTGGGKSLTYQLASMMQPGITIAIDPIKSLMQDQFDSLKKINIDACNFINSKLDRFEKEIATNQLTDSEVIFSFISPERLQIQSFRDALDAMYNNQVFFSYCVIDEVHCVSEWGHDFRTSYLSLGKNAIEHCKGKEYPNKLLPVFGLTATASYDVLSDVERELSGNGRADLDTEAIVRFENSNRDELQYNVVNVEVNFEREETFTKTLPNGESLEFSVTPLKTGVKNKIAEAKQEKLIALLDEIPVKLSGFNEQINFLKEKALERVNDLSQRDDVNIKIENFNTETFFQPIKENNSVLYQNAGIVFTPHKSWYQGVTDQFKEDKYDQDILDDAGNIIYRRGEIKKDEQGNAVRVPLDRRKGIADKIMRDASHIKVGMFMGSSDDAEKVGKEIEAKSFANQYKFINNQQGIMVATKAFGMGIDKPNVRYTIHFNYPGSIESFVQEAGRAGRDRKLALNSILFNQQQIVSFETEFYDEIKEKVSEEIFNKLRLLKGNLFLKEDIPVLCENLDIEDLSQNVAFNDTIIIKNLDRDNLAYFHNNSFKGEDKEKVMIFELLNKITYPSQRVTFNLAEEIEDITGESDVYVNVNQSWLNINADRNRIGAINLNTFYYSYNFSTYEQNDAKQILDVAKDLIQSNFPDYNNSQLLINWLNSTQDRTAQPGIEKRLVDCEIGQEVNPAIEVNFSNRYADKQVFFQSLTRKLQSLLHPNINENNVQECHCSNYSEFIKNLIAKRPDLQIDTIDTDIVDKGKTLFYSPRRKDDTDKALFRLMSIGVIDDYTVDYNLKTYTLKVTKKNEGEYIEALFEYIKRYYSESRAKQEIQKVQEYKGNTEIQKCLGFLTDFIYREVETKRLRAIDDMILACKIGLQENGNEELKDFIFLYFNSKYAKNDYTIEVDGEEQPYSLSEYTNFGRDFDFNVVWKFIKAIEIDRGGEKDNIKHLRGACLRLLRSNPENGALLLLKAFTLFALGYGDNANLFEETKSSFFKGVESFLKIEPRIEFNEIIDNIERFRDLTMKFSNDPVEVAKVMDTFIEQLYFNYHKKWLIQFNNKFLIGYDR